MSLRNSLVAKKLASERARKTNKAEEAMSEFDKLRRKYNRNAIIAKSFPVFGYNYPKRGLDKKFNPMYKTSAMSYGSLKPIKTELPDKYYPMDNKFTDEYCGGMYKYAGLNCAYSFSKSHRKNDGDL
jgi:hypothetical protein